MGDKSVCETVLTKSNDAGEITLPKGNRTDDEMTAIGRGYMVLFASNSDVDHFQLTEKGKRILDYYHDHT